MLTPPFLVVCCVFGTYSALWCIRRHQTCYFRTHATSAAAEPGGEPHKIMSREVKPVRRSLRRCRSCTFTEVARLVPSGCMPRTGCGMGRLLRLPRELERPDGHLISIIINIIMIIIIIIIMLIHMYVYIYICIHICVYTYSYILHITYDMYYYTHMYVYTYIYIYAYYVSIS